MTGKVWVTGFLGAGKSSLIRHADVDVGLEELGGMIDPTSVAGPEDHVITVVDAINFEACVADPIFGSLVRRQIAAASLNVVTRGDVIDVAPVLEAVKALTRAHVVSAPFGEVSAEVFSDLNSQPILVEVPVDITKRFAEWTYQGPAVLSTQSVERLLEYRPDGIYRLSGVARVQGGGLDMQVTGRTRQITPVAAPEQTDLKAIGARERFRVSEMDIAFAEAVAASAQASGIFSWR
jgi:G3E family GTPase